MLQNRVKWLHHHHLGSDTVTILTITQRGSVGFKELTQGSKPCVYPGFGEGSPHSEVAEISNQISPTPQPGFEPTSLYLDD